MTGKSKSEYTLTDAFNRIVAGRQGTNMSYHEAGWRLSYVPWTEDTNSSETAIILGEDECFLILYGDHRDALQGHTRNEAVAYWKAHPQLHGATSNTIED